MPLPLSYPNKNIVKLYAAYGKNVYLKGVNQMRPHQISLETAQKLAKALGVPLEQVMHMPQHILIQKLMELEKEKKDER